MIFKPKQVLEIVKKERSCSKNIMVLLFLDSNKKIVSSHRHIYLEQSRLKISDIFIPAFYLSAKYIIIVQIENKRDTKKIHTLLKDKEKTLIQKIVQAGRFLNVPLLDYLVVTKTKYYSAHESGLL